MSALTDKIEALMTQAQQAERPGQTNAPMGDIWPLLGDILADVRELEVAWTGADERAELAEDNAEAFARQAKREAYEHALSLVTKDSLDAATGNSKRVSYYRIHAALTGAIDALNTEGGAK